MAVELSPRPLLMVLKSMLTVIGFSIELSILAIAALIPPSMAHAFGLTVIELSKVGTIVMFAASRRGQPAKRAAPADRNEGQDSTSADDGCCY